METWFADITLSRSQNQFIDLVLRPCLFYLLDYGIAALQKPKSEKEKVFFPPLICVANFKKISVDHIGHAYWKRSLALARCLNLPSNLYTVVHGLHTNNNCNGHARLPSSDCSNGRRWWFVLSGHRVCFFPPPTSLTFWGKIRNPTNKISVALKWIATRSTRWAFPFDIIFWHLTSFPHWQQIEEAYHQTMIRWTPSFVFQPQVPWWNCNSWMLMESICSSYHDCHKVNITKVWRSSRQLYTCSLFGI
jgi:hypothetical protein